MEETITEKKKSEPYDMKVDSEFKEFCDNYAKKIDGVMWGAVDYSYREITKIIARKLKSLRDF